MSLIKCILACVVGAIGMWVLVAIIACVSLKRRLFGQPQPYDILEDDAS